MSQEGSRPRAPATQSDAGSGLGKRQPKLTVKALEARIASVRNENNSRIKKLHKLSKDVEQLILSSQNVPEVESMCEMFVRTMIELNELHESLKPLLPEDEVIKQNEWFETRMQSNREMINKMERWLQTTKEQFTHASDDDVVNVNAATKANVVIDDICPNDSVSNITRRTGTSAGRSSHRSNMSSISSACIMAEAEAAALSAMAVILKEKHALECKERSLAAARKCEEDSLAAARKCEEDSLAAARKCEEEQIRQRKEWLELQSGIAAYTAKANVLRYRGSEVQSSRADSNGMNSYLDRAKRKISLRPSATEFIPQGSEGQFNPLPKGGSRAVVSVETLHKDANLQYHNPTEDDKNFALSMGARPKDSNQQLHHTGGSTTLLPMEAFTATTIPGGNGSKAYELNPRSSQLCQQTFSATQVTHDIDRHLVQETNHHTGSMQSNVNQGNIINIMQRQNDITALLVQQQSTLSLPPREIPTFDGDPLEYSAFIRAFEHGVEAKTANNVDCLYFLEQYTKGQPKELVKSCQHMPPDRGYQRAKTLLRERFGNQQIIATAYMEQALGWTPVKAEDVKALQAFSLFLRVCCNAMEDISYMSEMNMPTNMRAMISKLPYKMRERWRNVAYELQERQHRQAGFSDIVKFVERQVSIVSDPLFGNIQDMSISSPTYRSRNNTSQPHSGQKGSSFVTSVEAVNCGTTPEKQQENSLPYRPRRIPCLLCEEDHNLETCSKMERMLHAEKISFLKEKGACFGCLAVGHISKDCHSRLYCQVCNSKHPTILHIHSPRKEVSSEDVLVPVSMDTAQCHACGCRMNGRTVI